MNQGHVFIENNFEILKNRWKILQSLIMKIDDGPPIVMACCDLHNHCQLMDLDPLDMIVWKECKILEIGCKQIASLVIRKVKLRR
jgi:hypothetical protein